MIWARTGALGLHPTAVLGLLWTVAISPACTEEPTAAPARDAGDGMTVPDATVDSGSRPPPSAFPVELRDSPTVKHPKPRGDYAVGTHLLHLVDQGRPELATDDPGDVRELMVQLFYPTESRAGPMAPVMEDEVAASFVARGLPEGFHQDIATRSRFDVPIASSSTGWPLLIYSHGLGSYRFDNYVLLEELASHGYVVAALSHPYQSAAVVFPDGRVAERGAVPEIASPEAFLERRAVFADLLDDVWLPDIRFVIGELEQLASHEAATWLAGELDFEHLGVFGYSFGGLAAFHFCLADERCDAAISMDGAFWEWEATRGRDLPFMLLTTLRHEVAWEPIRATRLPATYTIRIEGSTHANFGMLGLYWSSLFPALPLSAFGYGPIEPERAFQIKRDYVLGFLEQTLSGRSSRLLDGPSERYPEVLVEHSIRGESASADFAFGQVGEGLVSCNPFAFSPLVDVQVEASDDSRGATGADGTWRLDGLPSDSRLSLTFSHEGHFPVSWTARRTGHALSVPMVCLPAADTLGELAETVGVELDPMRGHVLVDALEPYAGAFLSGDGIALTASSGEPPAYLSQELELLPTAQAAPRTLLFNVTPGEVHLAFQHEALTCEALSGERAGATRVLVEPGHLTQVRVYCQ